VLSVTIICQNEENMIEDCLKSVRFADEIVIVDSGSTDKTLDICARYTDKIYHQDWLGMNQQKQFALGKTSGDWLFNIDADERVSEKLAEEIRSVLGLAHQSVVGYYVPRKAYYLGKWLKNGGWTPDFKLRLFQKEHGSWQGLDPHDQVVVRGQCDYLHQPLLHYSFRDLSDQWRCIESYASTAAREMDTRRQTSGISKILLHSLFAFGKSYFFKRGFLEGTRGLIQAIMISSGVALKYAKLWERHHVPGDKSGT